MSLPSIHADGSTAARGPDPIFHLSFEERLRNELFALVAWRRNSTTLSDWYCVLSRCWAAVLSCPESSNRLYGVFGGSYLR